MGLKMRGTRLDTYRYMVNQAFRGAILLPLMVGVTWALDR